MATDKLIWVFAICAVSDSFSFMDSYWLTSLLADLHDIDVNQYKLAL